LNKMENICLSSYLFYFTLNSIQGGKLFFNLFYNVVY